MRCEFQGAACTFGLEHSGWHECSSGTVECSSVPTDYRSDVGETKRVNACTRKFVSRRHSFRHYFHTQLALSRNCDIVLVTAETLSLSRLSSVQATCPSLVNAHESSLHSRHGHTCEGHCAIAMPPTCRAVPTATVSLPVAAPGLYQLVAPQA